MAFLYINSRGVEIKWHSYSAGTDFDLCPLAYYKKRIEGWAERDNKASLLFGRCVEDAIEFHHKNEGAGGVEEFTRLWAPKEAIKNTLAYTPQEVSWESLKRAGEEMLRLYAIRLPSLPLPLATKFQREFRKEVFPGTRLAGIEFTAKLDALPRVEPDHPALPFRKMNDLYRELVVDIKTSGIDLDETPGIVALDSQMRTYAWATGISDVAFLWFKKSPHDLSKGCSITFLEAAEPYAAGDEGVVAKYVPQENLAYVVKNDFMLEEMKKALGETKSNSKAGEAIIMVFLAQNAVAVSGTILTRQRLQFNAGIVTPESAAEAGMIAGYQISRIVNAWETNFWPNTFGIRFPNDGRKNAWFRAFVLNDQKFRDDSFEKKDEEWLDDTTEEGV